MRFLFFRMGFLLLIMPANIWLINAQNYSVNTKGTLLAELHNKANPSFIFGSRQNYLTYSGSNKDKVFWRVTQVDNGYSFLDIILQPQKEKRLLGTRYMPLRVEDPGIEAANDDFRWKIIPIDNQWSYVQHKSTGRYLSQRGEKCILVEGEHRNDSSLWKITPHKIDLSAFQSPIIMIGNDNTGFRDPAVLYNEGIFYMFYSLVLTEEEEKIYWYIAYSKSTDLTYWSDPEIITPKDQHKNFGSPGNVIRFNDEWILCMQTYVMPGYTRKDPLRFGNKDCRIWITRSKDLKKWSTPEMLYVKGDGVDPGPMIDAYLVEDKDEKGKWWCFYKQRGASYSYSYDLKNWVYQGNVHSGENVCVWVENDEYYMLHSPEVGMGLKKSKDLKTWSDVFNNNILGQENWQNWAGQRVTAGFVLDMRNNPLVGKYLMFFHGQGPAPKTTEIINSGTDLGIAWSNDLIHWKWPKTNQ